MNITSYAYLGFLALAGALYYLVPARMQNLLLLAASYIFYMGPEPRRGIVLAATTAATYFGALAAERRGSVKAKKRVCSAVAVFDILALAVFKYGGFFLETAGAALPERFSEFSMVAAVGLSFYTFQLVGYIADVARGRIAAESNIVDFALFAGFFPQILSGPIGRADELLPQYRRRREIRHENLRRGALRFLLGAFKKLVVADGIARYVDAVYANLRESAGLTLAAAILIYALQLYFDFSGYTDMAIGAADIFGITFRENFDVPYTASSISGFWQRWHMSLTSWLNDYIFFPLVWSRWGNRVFYGRRWEERKPHIVANIIIIFVISGLWHGASWTFVLWGLVNGIYRAAEEIVARLSRRKKGAGKRKGLPRGVKRAGVFALWAISLIFFRSDYLWNIPVIAKNLFAAAPISATADWVYMVMMQRAGSSAGYAKFTLALLVLATLLALALEAVMAKSAEKGPRRHNPLLALSPAARAAACIFMVGCILLIGNFGSSGFIYYRF
jgi:D-alanyl-lipoteichoic acid acyltransferase DltB (MBOAT superfamily)